MTPRTVSKGGIGDGDGGEKCRWSLMERETGVRCTGVAVAGERAPGGDEMSFCYGIESQDYLIRPGVSCTCNTLTGETGPLLPRAEAIRLSL